MRAPRVVRRTVADGASAPRRAALKVVPPRGRSAATKYLITFAHRFPSQKPASTAENHSLPGAEDAAGRLTPEQDRTVLDARALQESQRELMTLDIVCANDAAALVRAALSEIRELDVVHDDVMLVATELVNNAVLHSGGTAGDTLHVQAVLKAGHLLLSVDDPGLSDDIPQMQDADVSRASGHGLRIVNQLARKWGVETNGGHRVWAELATGHRDDTSSEPTSCPGIGSGGAADRLKGALQTFGAG
jgi:anti-sigma regulatory factor (Ser/Thr protein kinase)